MTQELFIESIKIRDGVAYNLDLHQQRMEQTMRHFFNITTFPNLLALEIPSDMQQGLVKCRILYFDHIESIEYQIHSFRQIEKLTVVDGGQISYDHKSANRSHLEQLLEQKGDGNDIIITRDGFVTDTSYSNLVFESESGLYTPTTYLLAGTKRKLLLRDGIILEAEIRIEDINRYSRVYLINSMMDIEDDISIDISDIILNS